MNATEMNITQQMFAKQAEIKAELVAALETIATAYTVGGISAGERKGMERLAAVARAALAKVQA